MGAPELPGDPGEEDLRPTEPIQHPQLASDESDNEFDDAYEGYQPLAIDEFSDEVGGNLDERIIPDNNIESEIDIQLDPSLPTIESADVEIERQVWNAPRPIQQQLELDTTRTAQILSAMANFTLPNVALPEWAVGVPEERWKEELLQRIRQRKELGQTQQNSAENNGSKEQKE